MQRPLKFVIFILTYRENSQLHMAKEDYNAIWQLKLSEHTQSFHSVGILLLILFERLHGSSASLGICHMWISKHYSAHLRILDTRVLRNEFGPNWGKLSIPSALVNEAAQFFFFFFFVLLTLILADGLWSCIKSDDASNLRLQDGTRRWEYRNWKPQWTLSHFLF